MAYWYQCREIKIMEAGYVDTCKSNGYLRSPNDETVI